MNNLPDRDGWPLMRGSWVLDCDKIDSHPLRTAYQLTRERNAINTKKEEVVALKKATQSLTGCGQKDQNICNPKKTRSQNSGPIGHFGRRWLCAVARLITTPSLFGFYVFVSLEASESGYRSPHPCVGGLEVIDYVPSITAVHRACHEKCNSPNCFLTVGKETKTVK